jgi:hypothetical protein
LFELGAATDSRSDATLTDAGVEFRVRDLPALSVEGQRAVAEQGYVPVSGAGSALLRHHQDDAALEHSHQITDVHHAR